MDPVDTSRQAQLRAGRELESAIECSGKDRFIGHIAAYDVEARDFHVQRPSPVAGQAKQASQPLCDA
jgi:hypothetical protein